MSQKNLQFKSFKNFSYTEHCNPKRTFKEKFKSINTIYTNDMFRSQYFKDISHLEENKELDLNKRKVLKKNRYILNIFDTSIYLYVPFSLLSHYSKGYFSKGNRKIEIYIFAKVAFNVLMIGYLGFGINKHLNDQLLFDYYSEKEAQWKESIKEKKEEYSHIKVNRIFR